MDKKEIIRATFNNAIFLLHMAKETGDEDLELIAQATIVSIGAVNNGDSKELVRFLSAYARFCKDRDENQTDESKVSDSIRELLNNSGISLN